MIIGIIGTSVAVAGLLIILIRCLLSIEHRLTKLETKVEPLYNGLTQLGVNTLMGVKAPGNPITQERYEYLLGKMGANSLSQNESLELNAALLELRKEAKDSNDLAKLLAVGLGLLILDTIMKKK